MEVNNKNHGILPTVGQIKKKFILEIISAPLKGDSPPILGVRQRQNIFQNFIFVDKFHCSRSAPVNDRVNSKFKTMIISQ